MATYYIKGEIYGPKLATLTDSDKAAMTAIADRHAALLPDGAVLLSTVYEETDETVREARWYKVS